MPPQPARRLWLVVVPFVVSVTGLVAAARPQSPESALVAWARAATWDSVAQDKSAIMLDLVPADVPALVDLLTGGDEPQRLTAARALGYGGGDAAIAALRTHRHSIRGASYMLRLALTQRGNAADRLELIRGLDPKASDSDAWLVWGTATTLGSMRATEAIPALERAAEHERPEARFVYDEALRWIRAGFNTVEGLPAATDDDRIVAAVMRHGVPNTGSGGVFTDEARGGVWILDGTTWRFRAGARAGGPALGFTIAFSAARTRALVSTSVVRGPLDGGGCDYLLTRQPGGAWRVDAMMSTWVA